jgi:RHS repeat-associated protein
MRLLLYLLPIAWFTSHIKMYPNIDAHEPIQNINPIDFSALYAISSQIDSVYTQVELQKPIPLSKSKFGKKQFLRNFNDTPNDYAPIAGTPSGHVAGQFNVSEAGTANYNIPLTLAAGSGGLKPELSLTYSSHGGNGLLGMGWSLNGLSVISRGNKTIAQDRITKGISLGNDDAYHLDGERIVAANASNTEFRTEQNAFIKINAYSTANPTVPDKFKVQTKEGVIMEYGFTNDSKIETADGKILYWLVNKIQDTKGNYIEFSYYEDNEIGDYRPASIRYTGNVNTGLTPYNTIFFDYIPRQDSTAKYLAGSKTNSKWLLYKISVLNEQQVTRKYQFDYEFTNKQGFITAIKEAGSDGIFLPPTVFKWKKGGEIGFEAPSQNNIPIIDLNNPNCMLINGDWDNDGWLDVMKLNTLDGTHKFFKNNNHFNFTQNTVQNVIPIARLAQGYIIPADYSNDGAVDLAWFNPNQREIRFFTNNNPLNFNQLAFSETAGTAANIQLNTTATDVVMVPIDANGDGATDLFFYSKSTGFNQVYQCIKNTSNAIRYQALTSIDPAIIQTSGDLFFTDANGDGLTDLLIYNSLNGNNYWYLLDNSGGAIFKPNQVVANPMLPASLGNSKKMYLADFNNDGNEDFIWYDNVTGIVKFFANKGNLSFVSTAITIQNNLLTASTDAELYIQDMNGDELADLFLYDKSNGINRLFTNDGKYDFNTPLNPNQPSQAGYQQLLPAASVTGGTGLAQNSFHNQSFVDAYWYDNATGMNRWFKGKTVKNSVIDTIVNGHGHQTVIEYATLSDSTVYKKEAFLDSTSKTLVGNLMIVKAYHDDNGIGGLNKTSFQYKGARINIEGRGFRGFSQVTKTDEREGLQQITFFEKDYRYLSAPIKRVESRTLAGHLLSEVVNENNIINFGYAIPVHYAYVARSTTQNYELNGSLISTQMIQRFCDDYGNPTKLITNSGDGFSDTTYNTYYNNVANEQWIIGRLVQTMLVRKSPTLAPVSRTSAFKYDLTTGLRLADTLDAGMGIENQVIKYYVFDAYGNIVESHTKAMTGGTVQDRVAYTVYDAKGRFVTEERNVLGHATRKTWDAVLGVPTSVTNANNKTIRFFYDGFGRQIKTLYPDGNWTTSDFRRCGTNPAIPTPLNAVTFIYHQSSIAPPMIAFLDVKDRGVAHQKTAFDGRAIWDERVFNARGNLTAVSKPHFQNAPIQYFYTYYDVLDRDTLFIAPGNRMTRKIHNGLTTTVINELGQRKTIVENAVGHLIQVVDNQNNTIQLDYDAKGNVVSSRDPFGNTIRHVYDAFNNCTQVIDPDLGTYQSAYNRFDEVVAQTNSRGQQTTFNYDVIGRKISQVEPEGDTYWHYDTQPNGIGLLARVVQSNGHQIIFDYDTLSRVTAKTETILGVSYRTQFEYDRLGRIKTMTYPSGFKIANIYNSLGFLSEVRNDSTNQLYWRLDEMDAQGHTLRQTAGNNVSTVKQYETETDYLQTIVSTKDTSTIQNLGYQFNALGNLISRSERKRNISEFFNYDSLNRLVSALIPNQDTLNMRYDRLGNITYKSDVGTYRYGENGGSMRQLTSVVSNQAVNRCIPSLAFKYEFGSFDKVTRIEKDSIHSMTLQYGADKHRIVQNRFEQNRLMHQKIYVGLYEKEITDTLIKEIHYIESSEGVIAVFNQLSNGRQATHYWHADHLGSLQSVSDENGRLIAELSYDAWGKRRNADWTPIRTDSVFQYARGFTGHEHIDFFDLINMNGRVYDPVLGRFLSPDPFVQDPTNLQNYNRYAYVLNNPLSMTDPSGYFFKKAFKKFKKFFKKAIVAIVGIAATVLTGGVAGAGFAGAFLSGMAAGFASSFTNSILSGQGVGGSLRTALKSGLISGAMGVATFGVGQQLGHSSNIFAIEAKRALAHGVIQGLVPNCKAANLYMVFYRGLFRARIRVLTARRRRGWIMFLRVAASEWCLPQWRAGWLLHLAVGNLVTGRCQGQLWRCGIILLRSDWDTIKVAL